VSAEGHKRKKRTGPQSVTEGAKGEGGWHMEGFRVDPGSEVMVQEGCSVGRVECQVELERERGKEMWLGVMLVKGSKELLGWMCAEELRRRAAEGTGWAERLRGETKEGWDVNMRGWVSKKGALVADRRSGGMRGTGRKGEVVGWYLPVLIEDGRLSKAGVRLSVQMRRVAVGVSPGGYEQTVRVSSRREWCRHEMNRRDLVAITGEQRQADGKSELLVEGQEVWQTWSRQGEGPRVQNETEWWKQSKREWRDRERAVDGRGRMRFKDRDQTYDKG